MELRVSLSSDLFGAKFLIGLMDWLTAARNPNSSCAVTLGLSWVQLRIIIEICRRKQLIIRTCAINVAPAEYCSSTRALIIQDGAQKCSRG